MGVVAAALRGVVNRLSTGATGMVHRVVSSAPFRPLARWRITRFDALSRRELGRLGAERAGFRSPAPRAGARPVRARPVPVPQVVVPDVVGLRPEQAGRELERQQLRVHQPDLDVAPTGALVVRQFPEAGRMAPVGAIVTLWFGAGPGDAGVREPRRPDPDLRTLRGAADPGSG